MKRRDMEKKTWRGKTGRECERDGVRQLEKGNNDKKNNDKKRYANASITFCLFFNTEQGLFTLTVEK